jgi:hypothetical protein
MIACPLCEEVEETEWFLAAHIRCNHLPSALEWPALCWCGYDFSRRMTINVETSVISECQSHIEKIGGFECLKRHIDDNVHLWLPRVLTNVPA